MKIVNQEGSVPIASKLYHSNSIIGFIGRVSISGLRSIKAHPKESAAVGLVLLATAVYVSKKHAEEFKFYMEFGFTLLVSLIAISCLTSNPLVQASFCSVVLAAKYSDILNDLSF